ncbi:maestro-related heat domain-containing [Holotrichia oblita]|uniref:Maestro-related heat domain-containing n=1 Tax=Holotrichia oblita TaxID=644536 RepID=A0ACB9TD17_HOLOL|nr:maestro-related heat domain-containing [Holotrichia oblita]
MDFDDRLKLDNFQQPTTYANDYRQYYSASGKRYRWPKATEEEQIKLSPEFYEQDTETFYPFKKEHHVPFNLLWRPRPIVETNPNTSYPKHLKKRRRYL